MTARFASKPAAPVPASAIDSNGPGLEPSESELGAGVTCSRLSGDVGNRDRVRAAFDAIETALGPVECLLTAAGICDHEFR